jgi:acyl-coenzyme A thioesterase 13
MSFIETEKKTPLESVTSCWTRIRQTSPVYNFFFTDIALVSARHGSMLAHLPVGLNHINSKHTLHGSVSATIVDWAGGMAIASTGLEQTGFSTDIHVSYVSTAKEGDVLTIEGKVSRVGRNMAFTTVTIYKGEGVDGSLEGLTVVATGTHTKYILRDQEQARKP